MPTARGGGGWLTATLDGASTRLTRIAHRTPTRLLPLKDSVGRLEAAHCAVGGYGGGLLGGDEVHLDVKVEAGARLCLTTQASTKVYCAKRDAKLTRQTLTASVEEGGLLVLAPDPVVPYAKAAYEQQQTFWLAPGASLVAVDWVGAGRVSRGERWAFSSFSSCNQVFRARFDDHPLSKGNLLGRDIVAQQPDASPLVIDAVRMQGGADGPVRLGLDLGLATHNSAITVLCSGADSIDVCRRLRAAASALADRRAGARPGVLKQIELDAVLDPSGQAAVNIAKLAKAAVQTLLGEVVMGVSTGVAEVAHESAKASISRVPRDSTPAGDDQEVTVARLVAENMDDVFRVLHFCLDALTPALGIAPYSGRIHAVNSAPAPIVQLTTRSAAAGGGSDSVPRVEPLGSRAGVVADTVYEGSGPAPLESDPLDCPLPHPSLTSYDNPLGLSSAQRIRMLHLCDATLPTGGFAHSAGLEVAAQLGIIRGDEEEDLKRFVNAAATGASALLAPYAASSCAVFGCGATPFGGPSSVGEQLPLGIRAWGRLNARLNAQLLGNSPAHRASVEQGRALIRVGEAWLQEESEREALRHLLKVSVQPHGATTLGALCALLGLTPEASAEALAYMATRDVLSAAVRLNLIGPLAAVGVQTHVAEIAVMAARNATALGVSRAATAAPLIEALHPCHDLLDRRIFRT